MQIYLVGGAIRDRLLHIKNADHDWCVTGATPEEMLKLGFYRCGKDFPVFIHPETHEEYALARKERKEGHGYHGFICDFGKEVTIEEDLLRRDLTINAIAEDEDHNLIDPTGGIDDLNKRILRHVSDAFIEDPLRVLRLARFYARFAKYGFKVAYETIALCKKIVASNELTHLTPQRIWLETEKALATDNPELYFIFLEDIGALEQTMPEISALSNVPQEELYHPEGNAFNHTMLTLKESVRLTSYLPLRFAMLTHDLGKVLTPKEQLPAHPMHRALSKDIITSFAKRLQTPNEYLDLALKIGATHTYVNLLTMNAKELLTIFTKMDAYRNHYNITYLAIALAADFFGRKISFTKPFYPPYFISYLFTQSLKINVADIIKEGFKNKEISEELAKRRINVISQAQKLLQEQYEDYDNFI